MVIMEEKWRGTPLIKKLGVKPGMKICILDAPPDYDELLGKLPPSVEKVSLADLENQFSSFKAVLAPAGMLWVSWLKKSAKQPTDLTEDIIRHIALANGFVDVKVCAVNQDWSGLKLVYRLKDR
jgi:hypothetical protein